MKRILYGFAVALLALTGCTTNNETSEKTDAVVSFDDVFTSRRSIRSYDASKKISGAELSQQDCRRRGI